MIISGILAIVIAYLLGSIPGAYIVTRLLTGKDIRKLGGGNVGARNVYREVGIMAAIPVVIIDVGKGIAAVAIAEFVLLNPPLFVALAGLAAVAGHIWPVYLKFSGGNGLATTIGVLSLLMTRELLIVLGIMLVISLITRNPILSLNISLLSLPVSGWILKSWLPPWQPMVFSILLLLIMIINFLPTAKVAIAKAGGSEKLIADLIRFDKTGKK